MKKLFSLLLALAMLVGMIAMFPITSGATDPVVYTKGDVNGDGRITTKDSLILKKYLAAMVDFNLDQATAADMDGDVCVTAKDSRTLIGYLVCTIKDFSTSELSLLGISDRRQNVKIGGVQYSPTTYCIVMPEEFKTPGLDYNCYYNAAKGFHFAVRRLKGFLGTITGLDQPTIVGANDTATLANYPHKIYCLADSNGTYGEDGFNISTSNGDVYLTCSADSSKLWTQRGMFYAVFTFLEDYFDVKFYEDMGPYIPQRGPISIPNGINRTEQPGFNYRVSAGWSFSQKIGGAPNNAPDANTYGNYWEQPKWYLITRKINGFDGNYSMNDPQVGYAIGSLQYHAHSLGEYLGTPGSNPCLTNSTEKNTIINAIKSLINDRRSWSDYQYITQISCSQEDVVSYCTCENCKAKYSYYGCFNGIYMEFVNEVADMLNSQYPGAGYVTYSVLYDHTVPDSSKITPRSNEIWCYCGTGCNNHTIEGGHGTNDQCSTSTRGDVYAHVGNSRNGTFSTTYNGQTLVVARLNDGVNIDDRTRIAGWVSLTHSTGAEFYFWYYPTNVHFFMAPTPNYTNIYYDFKYLADAGVDGIYCEGDTHRYAFEGMREYLASEMLWNPDMSFAQYEKLMDKYLEAHCGHGWRYIRKYIDLYEAAGNEMNCWCNNYDGPWVMLSRAYFMTHYDEMRECFDKALACEHLSREQETYLKCARLHCDFLGLSSLSGSSYSDTNRTRYAEMFNFIKNNASTLGSRVSLGDQMGAAVTIPSSINYSDPMSWYDRWENDTYKGTDIQTNPLHYYN